MKTSTPSFITSNTVMTLLLAFLLLLVSTTTSILLFHHHHHQSPPGISFASAAIGRTRSFTTTTVSLTLSVSGTRTISKSGTKSYSKSGTNTPVSVTGTRSGSVTATRTRSGSKTVTGTTTRTRSASSTVTRTASSTVTGTKTGTATASRTGSYTVTRSSTASLTVFTNTRTLTRSLTTSKTITGTKSRSATLTRTGTETRTGTSSVTKTSTPSRTITFTPTITSTASRSITGSRTVSSSETRSKSITVTPISLTDTMTKTMTATKSATGTFTRSQTFTPTKTATKTQTATITRSQTFTSSKTATKTNTLTFTRSLSGSASHSESESESVSSSTSPSASESPSESSSASASASLSESLSFSDSQSFSVSSSSSQSESASESPSFSFSSSSSFSLSESESESESVTLSRSESGTADRSMSFSISKSRFTDTKSASMPLTTSAMPPTTSPMNTSTLTFMTRCPSNCFQGVCNNAYPYQCVCYRSILRGYWGGSELGGPCDKCMAGFFGPRCSQVCSGGSCAACGGHGVCDDGQTGTGDCICFNSTALGFWAKTPSGSCSRCQTDHWGINCQSKCQCVAGKCFEGRSGNGTCFDCPSGRTGSFCEICDPNVVLDCKNTLTCPLGCNGNGICRQVTGSASFDGECDCYPNFAGLGCEITCPGMIYYSATSNASCNARSTCNDGRTGDGTCQACIGNFAGASCAECEKGYWGTGTCSNVCPGSISAPCNNNGTCIQATGLCQCNSGSSFGGPNCNISCPVGTNGLSCSGNGDCDANADCTCYQDSTRGFWNGSFCDVCNDGYRGTGTCNIQCPVLSGRICSDNGTCNAAGKCECFAPYCGRVCDTILNGTRCNSCPIDGFYGPNCDTPCQCVNGNCSQGINGDGSCECNEGWGGAFCNISCPLGAGNLPCSGQSQGSCIQATASCHCEKGFAGLNCSLSCPDLNCSGNGLCNDTTAGDGTCDCFDGFVGEKCDTRCNDCGSHGSCVPGNSTCICFGNFTGDNCDRCISGFSGANCTDVCVNGVTNGTECSCFDDWVLPQCDGKCPIDPITNLTCGGPAKGTCNKQTGSCVCGSPLDVGPACSCSVSDCQARFSTLDVICDSTSGDCICDGNRDGLATGCDKCKLGFWSSNCQQNCECNNHGTCAKETGACACYSDPVNGYWQGVTCNTCQNQYMGATCQQRAVSITTVPSINYPFQIPIESQYTLIDEDRLLYFVGAGYFNFVFNVTPTIPTIIDSVFREVLPGVSRFRPVDGFNREKCINVTRGGEGGNVAGLHYFHHPANTQKQLLYILHQNTTCVDIPIRAYVGPSSPLDFFLKTKTRVISEILPIGLALFSFYFASTQSTCIVTSSQELSCQYVIDPTLFASPAAFPILSNVVTELLPFNFLRFAAKTPSDTFSRVVVSGSDTSSRCAINFLSLATTGAAAAPQLSFVQRTQLHDVANEVRLASGSASWTCRSVDSFHENTAGFLVYAAQADRGNYIGGFTTTSAGYTLKSGGVFPANPASDVIVFEGAIVTSVPATGRGIVYDLDSGIGLAVFNALVIKFRFTMNLTTGLDTVIEPYGQRLLTVTNIYKLDLFVSQQIVYAPRKLVRGVEIVRFLMIEVLSIDPSIADRRGGAVITVTGTGFRNVSTAVCQFGSGRVFSTVPATYLSAKQVTCVAPFSDSTATCLSQAVEVSMNGNMFTQNNILIDRPNDVIILNVTPSRVRVNTVNQNVRLIGRGFVYSDSARCKLVIDPEQHPSDASNNNNPLWTRIYDAIYVSPTQYDCNVPVASTMTFPGSYMTLALDGEVFSSTSAQHSVLGIADSVLCTPSRLSAGTTIPSNNNTNNNNSVLVSNSIPFPPWPTIFIRDKNKNLLFDFDDQPTRSVTIRPSEGFNITFPSSSVPTYPYVISGGTGKLAGYRVPDPIVGVRPTFIDVDSGLFTCSFETEIVPGDLAKLRVRTQPVSPTDLLLPQGLLPQTTEVVLLDIGNNPITLAGKTITLNVSFVSYDPLTGTVNNSFFPQAPIAVRENGVASLAPFLVELNFGVEYAIYFVVASDPSIFTYTTKFTPSCPRSQFQVIGEGFCRDCALEADCDGSTVLLNRPGFWRLNNRTTTFLQCRNYAACPGGTPESYGSSRCAHEYQGILCDDCIDDFAKNSEGLCQKCPVVGTQVALFILIVFLMLVLLFSTIVMSLQNSPVPTSSIGRAAVLVAILVTHFQTLSFLSFVGINWGAAMTVVLNIAAFLFEFRIFSLHSINCLFRSITGMNYAYAWIIFILFSLLVIPMILVVKFVLKCKPDLFLSSEGKKLRLEFERRAKKSYTGFWTEGWVKEHQTRIIALVCCQVFLYFLIQVDFYYLLAILTCIVVGRDDVTGQDIRVMSIDVRVDCNSSEYETMKALAITFAVFLGFFATFGTMTLMGYYRYRRYEDDFESAWSFLFLGVKITSWPWNPLIMIKKFIMVLIISLLNDEYPIALYLILWITMIWSWLEFDTKPYTDNDFNQLSMVFNLVMLVVTNIGMTLGAIEGDLVKTVLDAFSTLLIISSLIFFFWKCSRMFVARYIQERKNEATEYIEDVDEQTIEAELQKRLDQELNDEKNRSEEEMKSIERIRKELRVKAIAERRRAKEQNGNNNDDNDDEMMAVAKDHRQSRRDIKNSTGAARDTFSTILDDFHGAAEDEEKEKMRQSRGAEEFVSWTTATDKTGKSSSSAIPSAFDDLNNNDHEIYNDDDLFARALDDPSLTMKRRGGGINNNMDETASSISAISSASKNRKSGRKHNRNNEDDSGPVTSYNPKTDKKPPLHSGFSSTGTSKNGGGMMVPRIEVDDAIDDFFGGNTSDYGNNDYGSSVYSSPGGVGSGNNNNKNYIDDDDDFFANASPPTSNLSINKKTSSSQMIPGLDLDISQNPFRKMMNSSVTSSSGGGGVVSSTPTTPKPDLQQPLRTDMSVTTPPSGNDATDRENTNSKQQEQSHHRDAEPEFSPANYTPPPPPPPVPLRPNTNSNKQKHSSSSLPSSSRQSPLQQQQRRSSPAPSSSSPFVQQNNYNNNNYNNIIPASPFQHVQDEKSKKQTNLFLPPQMNAQDLRSTPNTNNVGSSAPAPPIPVPMPNNNNNRGVSTFGNNNHHPNQPQLVVTSNPFASARARDTNNNKDITGLTPPDTPTPTKSKKSPRKSKKTNQELQIDDL